MTLSILINAATLKGYLMATSADADAIRMAEEIVAAEIFRLTEARTERAPAFVANEDVRIHGPDPETLPRIDLPANLRPIDEPESSAAKPPAEFPSETPSKEIEEAAPVKTVIAAPETTPTEENSVSSAGEGAEAELLSRKDKHKRYREKLRKEGRCPRCGVECAPYAECEAHRKYKMEKRGFDEYKRLPEHGQRAPRRESILKPEMLADIQEQLATKSFGVVGHMHGVSGETVKNFLKRHGIDTAQYRKSSSGIPAVEIPGQEHAPIPRNAYLWKPEDKQKLLEMKTAGKGWPEIAAVVDKRVSQCRSMWHLERNKAKKSGAAAHEQAGARGGIDAPKLFAENLPQILEELETRSFSDCGSLHGVTGHAIVDFLKRSGVNHEQFKKKPGHGIKVARAELDADGWPLAVKPEKVAPPLATGRTSEREEAIARALAAMPGEQYQKNSRLSRADIPKILHLLGDLDAQTVGERFGVKGHQIDDLLKKYGIDYRTLPPKATQCSALPGDGPVVKFETVTITDRLGNERERHIPLPLGEYKDPATGATVTKYPPMYAFGAGPQKNTYVKGGS